MQAAYLGQREEPPRSMQWWGREPWQRATVDWPLSTHCCSKDGKALDPGLGQKVPGGEHYPADRPAEQGYIDCPTSMSTCWGPCSTMLGFSTGNPDLKRHIPSCSIAIRGTLPFTDHRPSLVLGSSCLPPSQDISLQSSRPLPPGRSSKPLPTSLSWEIKGYLSTEISYCCHIK